ncbi:DUF6207 family protein [Streptomyces scopuliridis]
MKEITPEHVREPGLLVLDIAAADEDTALAAVTTLSLLWKVSRVTPAWHVPGQPGVRARLHAHLGHVGPPRD